MGGGLRVRRSLSVPMLGARRSAARGVGEMSTAAVDMVRVHGFGRQGRSVVVVVVVVGRVPAMEGKVAGWMCRSILLRTSW